MHDAVQKVAERDCAVTRPVCLDLALCFPVFQYEALSQPEEECKVALDDKPEHQSITSRLAFVKRRLGMEKHRALAQLTSSQAPVSMDVGNLDLTASANSPFSEEDDADPSRLEAACSFARSKQQG